MESIILNNDVELDLPDGAVPLNNQVAGHRHGIGKTKYDSWKMANYDKGHYKPKKKPHNGDNKKRITCLHGNDNNSDSGTFCRVWKLQEDGIAFNQQIAYATSTNCQDDTVLKAIQGPPRGTREKIFYQSVFQSPHSSEHIIKLRHCIPRYYGIFASKQTPVEYLKLEDISKQFDKPCIADIKMGKVTYDPEATAEKEALEKSKWPAAVSTGFSIIGMRVYNQHADEFTYHDKNIVRKMVSEDLMYKGIDTFFQAGDPRYHGAIKTVLNKLQEIDAWFTAQRELAFYSSSLLIIYEGNVDNDNNENVYITNSDAMSDPHYDWPVIKPKVIKDRILADVRMIDFAHVFPTTEYDDNYMHGLRNLQKCLKRLLVKL